MTARPDVYTAALDAAATHAREWLESVPDRPVPPQRTIEEVREIFDEVRKDIWPAVESRKLQLPIDKVYPFAEIGKAFEHMEANKHLGKIVVAL